MSAPTTALERVQRYLDATTTRDLALHIARTGTGDMIALHLADVRELHRMASEGIR